MSTSTVTGSASTPCSAHDETETIIVPNPAEQETCHAQPRETSDPGVRPAGRPARACPPSRTHCPLGRTLGRTHAGPASLQCRFDVIAGTHATNPALAGAHRAPTARPARRWFARG